MNIIWKTIIHNELQDELINIANIKDQYWVHGISSQIKWIEENLDDKDIHLIGINNDSKEVVAYMALMNVNAVVNNMPFSLLGLSNVCVDSRFKGKGVGSQLVNQANRYIIEQQKKGILLCKDSLISFYNKNGWRLLEYKEAFIKDDLYNKDIMIFNVSSIPNNCCIKLSKNF